MKPSEFKRAVYKGRGKAFFDLRKGVEPHHVETLKWATTRWPGYDPYFCGGYARYVAYLLREAGLEERAIGWIEDEPPEPSRDLNHRAGVLAELSGLGLAQPKAVLKKLFQEFPWCEESELNDSLIAVDGVEGLRCVLKKSLESGESEVWSINGWVEAAQNVVGKRKVAHFLAKAHEEIGDVNALLKQTSIPKVREPKERRRTWGEVKAELEHVDVRNLWSVLRAWGPKGHELGDVADYILADARAKVVKRLGRHIRGRFPDPERLIPRVLSCKDELRAAYVDVLVDAGPVYAREAGRKLLDEGDFLCASEALGKAGAEEDAPLLLANLPTNLRNQDLLHFIASNVLNSNAPGVGWLELARWTYEQTPCSFCRKGAVRKLTGSGAMPKRLLRECLYDCEPETRKVARRAMRTSEGVPV